MIASLALNCSAPQIAPPSESARLPSCYAAPPKLRRRCFTAFPRCLVPGFSYLSYFSNDSNFSLELSRRLKLLRRPVQFGLRAAKLSHDQECRALLLSLSACSQLLAFLAFIAIMVLIATLSVSCSAPQFSLPPGSARPPSYHAEPQPSSAESFAAFPRCQPRLCFLSYLGYDGCLSIGVPRLSG